MLQSLTTKATVIQLARSMKHAYLESPQTYCRCSPFRSMQNLIENITLDNFSLPPFPKKVSQGQIYTEDKLRISLFFVPKGTEMPLHDHPGMFVQCKILKGRLIRDSFKLHSNYWQYIFPQHFLEVTPEI